MASNTSAPRDTTSEAPVRPDPTALQGQSCGEQSQSTLRAEAGPSQPKKRKNHRGKKKKNRRQSFAPSEDNDAGLTRDSHAARDSFYRLQGRNHSNTSLESDALLDHREHQSMRPRRSSIAYEGSTPYRQSYSNPFVPQETRRPKTGKSAQESQDEEDDAIDENAPLISPSARTKNSGVGAGVGYGPYGDKSQSTSRARRESSRSSSKSKKKTIFDKQSPDFPIIDYDVNHPPSMPTSPQLGAMNRDMSFGDSMMREEPEDMGNDYALDSATEGGSMAESPRLFQGRRHTIAMQAEEDVCFPVENMSEMADDDHDEPTRDRDPLRRSRRRKGKWPDLTWLDEFSRTEKEGRSAERRVRKITEPALIGGRLRPIHKGWHRAEDDAPYRFTYFNEELQSTIHSQSISELVQPGGSFRELFIPDPMELEDSSSEEEDEPTHTEASYLRHSTVGANGDSRVPTRQGSVVDRPESRRSTVESRADEHSGEATPSNPATPKKQEKQKRFGERPTWWLDVLSPTDAEMRTIAKTFGIHPLTSEDILMQEAREKVELFRNYYFVNYRSFEQDMNNDDFLEPVNMYVVVFREGVISFHFSMTPHPANVRRRIRQLQDYLMLTSDWISYAIIDDITDVFAPLIQNIEDEVDDIDDAILKLHSPQTDDTAKNAKDAEKKSEAGDGTSGESGGDMLRRVGDCRKKVMGLYRLLGNKADVIKGFAKRCNEHWEVAPRSEIGLYLGDIQDHIVTMTGNLSHYEKILARSHGNYLAQINIRMNERQEQTADVLGKLTVLGTIVLPMNIITGLWGMNVWVPGQEYEGNLAWFWCITAGLLVFGLACFFIAKTLYRIV